MKTLLLLCDADAQLIFREAADDIQRQLQQRQPGLTLTTTGTTDGSKDAVNIITATAALIATSVPIVKMVLQAYFAHKGFVFEDSVDASGQEKLIIKRAPAKRRTKPS